MRRGLLGLGAALGMILSALPLEADCQLCGEWSAGAHALYFVPLTCPYTYASLSVQTSSTEVFAQDGTAQQVPCGADWGFRLFGSYADGCWFADLSYQWFETTNANDVSTEGAILVIPGGNAFSQGDAVGRTRIEYQNVDLRVGGYLLRRRCLSTYAFVNGRWVDLSYRRSLRALDTLNDVRQNLREESSLKGGALGIGVGARADVGCGLGSFVEGNVLGVIGRRSIGDVEYRFQVADNTPSVTREFYPTDTCVLPEFTFRLGVDYGYQCGCFSLVGELGFEVDYFCRGVGFPDLTGTQLTSTEDFFTAVCEDIGFSGLFFGLRIIF